MSTYSERIVDTERGRAAQHIPRLPRSGRLAPISGFVGRVGALAVALGVGIAVIGSPGIALAEAGDGEPGAADAQPDPAPPGDDDPVDDDPVDDDPIEDNTDEPPADENELEEDNLDDEEDDLALVVETDFVGTEPTEVLVETTPNTDTSTSVTPPPPALVAAPPVAIPASNNESTPPDKPVPPPVVTSTELPAPESKSTDPNAAAALSSLEAPAARFVPQSDAQLTLLAFDAPALDTATFSALEMPPAQPVSTALTAPVGLISTVVTTLLAPLLAPAGPAAPAQTPILWAVLAWVRRQFEHTFANKAPVIVNNNDTELVEPGIVTGTVTAYDPDPEDRVVLSYRGGDPDADINVAPNGQWTYTAPPDWDGAATHTDSFTVTATEY